MSPSPHKNQLPVPRALLRVAGLQPGDVVHTRRTRPGRVELLTGHDTGDRLTSEDATGYPPGYLDELRSAWS